MTTTISLATMINTFLGNSQYVLLIYQTGYEDVSFLCKLYSSLISSSLRFLSEHIRLQRCELLITLVSHTLCQPVSLDRDAGTSYVRHFITYR